MPGAAAAHASGLLKTVAFASTEAPQLSAMASAAARAADLENRLKALRIETEDLRASPSRRARGATNTCSCGE